MRLVRALALLPLAAVLVGPFFLNRVTPFLLGMPFLMGWLALALVVTSIVMRIIYVSDSKLAEPSDEVGGNGGKA